MCVLEHQACEVNHTEPGKGTEETQHGAGLCVMVRPPAYWTHATPENDDALDDVTSFLEITSWLEEWMCLTSHDVCKINAAEAQVTRVRRVLEPKKDKGLIAYAFPQTAMEDAARKHANSPFVWKHDDGSHALIQT